MRRTLLALGSAVLFLSSCGGTARSVSSPTTQLAASPPPPAASTPTSPAPPPTTAAPPPAPVTTTTSVPDRTVVPKRITVAYVDAVLAKLNHVYGDAGRAMVSHRRLTPVVHADLAKVYTARLAATENKVFTIALGQLKEIRHHPGDPVSRVVRLITASPTCIFARVVTDTSKIARRTSLPVGKEYIGLARRYAYGAAGPTPWLIFYDSILITSGSITTQCAA